MISDRSLARVVEALRNPLDGERLVRANVLGAVDEFCSRLFEELDYRREASNCETFATLYGPDGSFAQDVPSPGLKIPELEKDLCSRRVLVMEWVEGERLAPSPDATEDLPLVEMGISATLLQLLGTGVMHTDPHGGNLLKGPQMEAGSRRADRALRQLVYLDFGLVAEVPLQVREGLVCAVMFMVQKRWADVAGLFNRLMLLPDWVLADADTLENFTHDIQLAAKEALQFPEANEEKEVPSLRFAALLEQLALLAPRYEFQLPPYFLNNARALGCLEGNGAAFAAPGIFKTLRARDFMNHQLFNGLNQSGTELKLAVAVVPSLREFLANPMPGIETDGANPALFVWKNGKYAKVPTITDLSEKQHLVVMAETLPQVNEALQAIDNNKLMDPAVSKLPRCAFVWVNDGHLQSLQHCCSPNALWKTRRMARTVDPSFNILEKVYPFALDRLLSNPSNSHVLTSTLHRLCEDEMGRLSIAKADELVASAARLSGKRKRTIVMDSLRTKGGRQFFVKLFGSDWVRWSKGLLRPRDPSRAEVQAVAAGKKCCIDQPSDPTGEEFISLLATALDTSFRRVEAEMTSLLLRPLWRLAAAKRTMEGICFAKAVCISSIDRIWNQWTEQVPKVRRLREDEVLPEEAVVAGTAKEAEPPKQKALPKAKVEPKSSQAKKSSKKNDLQDWSRRSLAMLNEMGWSGSGKP
eukprot:s977_g14.t3